MPKLLGFLWAQCFLLTPPYYDNIGYADLSDFFFCWMRPALQSVYPDLFGVLATPKQEELVATPYRHNSKKAGGILFLGRHVESHRQHGAAIIR